MSDGDAPERGDGNENDNEKFVETAFSAPVRSKPARPLKDHLIGTTVSGYIVKGKLGQGGMGIVYEGEQPVIGKRVAIKVLRPEIADNPEQVKRLVEEARAVNTVGHRGIIDVFGFGEVDDGRQCIVMEFLDGESLMDLLARNQKEHKAMPFVEVLQILEEILSALGAAHGAGVVHRDLKPSNIFLCRQRDGTKYVKVLDFGIAKLGVHGTTPQNQASMLVGTPSYMAPEQARGGMISPSLDLYAVGVIAFEMLTGTLPFLGNSVIEVLMKHAEEPPPRPSTLMMSIPDDIDEIILKLLSKKPDQRHASAEVVRLQIAKIRKGLSVSTATRTELDLELDKRLKKQLQSMILPDNGAAIDLGNGEDATLPPSRPAGRPAMLVLPSAEEQMKAAGAANAVFVQQPPEEPKPDRPTERGLAAQSYDGEATKPPDAPAKGKGLLLVIGAVIIAAAIAAYLYFQRLRPPQVIELPVPEQKVAVPPPPPP